MQNNPPQNQAPSKDYSSRSFPPSGQDHGSEPSSAGFPHKPPANPPVSAKNIQNSNTDTRPQSDQSFINPSGEPIQVKHLQAKTQPQLQPQAQTQSPSTTKPQPQLQPQLQTPGNLHGQIQHQYPNQTLSQMQTQPQPIINPQTILALNYLQTHLLGGRNNILENQAHMISENPLSNDGPSMNQSQNDLNGSPYDRRPRDNYYGDQRGNNRNDFRDNRDNSSNRGYNNNKRDFHPRNNGPNDYDKPRRNMNYSTERAVYEKSRSRSNEKRSSYDTRPTFNNSYQKEGYRNRNGYDNKPYKEHQGDRSFPPKQKSDCYEDWKCLSCGNVNWARRENCNKCGLSKPEDAPVVINPLRDNAPKTMLPQETRNIEYKGYPNNEGYNKTQYYRDDGRRNDYNRNMEPRNNQGGRPNYGNAGFKP